MKIGIDVGGTNTDAVLIDGSEVLAGVKSPTMSDVGQGITGSLRRLQSAYSFDPADVDAVMIGTTHFINALVEAERLAPTAAIRLGLPATGGLPPFVGWPARITEALHALPYMCHGGHEFDGREISPINHDEIRRAAQDAVTKGARSFAISSVFSPVNSEFEQMAAEIINAEFPELPVSLSNEIGRVGLLERENATIINAALRELSADVCSSLDQSLLALNIHAPLFLSQNDGTLMDVDFARKYPVATFASGPTNSMRGAAYLSGLKDCIVVDVGGTTTDVGVLQSGFPREAATEIEVAGIRTNFRMPDVLSVGLGGGSRIRFDSGVTVGPDSVGYRVTEDALVFGGKTLTATDIMVAAGDAEIGDPGRVSHLDPSMVKAAKDEIHRRIAETVDRMRTSSDLVPVVAVGGGAFLVPEQMACASDVARPGHSGVANAIGAAIAQVGGEVDRIFAIPAGKREEVLDQARGEAISKAIAAGAKASTVQIVEIDELPLAYLPGNASRVRVKAVGDLPASK
ncbi:MULTISPECIES: hydantoinase/oxoprolinase family protein [unclassified Arthrobacter]|uniref:hydantoinase/oxoprolinase family protein n=1 Tax=unclassified Arthrobacter TaxID=235627 RepID=UPI001F2AF348|nr:hydantoinase/oxoprolinase family protein [Arthrobacter sp. FW305-BF8]UKA54434.1 hydantoinase/oxoprolinase family protein [Arthrobacter sp. FW305-BF8]